MITFEVKDMTCGHCVSSVTKAVQAIDPQAKLNIDLPSKRVQIEAAATDARALQSAIEDAGFTPTVVG